MNELTLTHETKTPKWFKAVLFAGMLLFAFYASTHMVAAGDTWVAMACGRHFDNHGVNTVEPFSFNSHKAGPSEETLEKFPEWSRGLIKKWHPTGWINQNWLTHLIFYKLATWFGDADGPNYNMLIYWKFVLYGLTVFSVYAIGRVIGMGAFLSAASACFAVVIGRTFYDIRPAGYSNLLVPVLILIFALTIYRNYRWIWLIVPLVVFWANVHGGYLYAFIMLVPFVGIHLLLRLPRRWSICLGFIGLWLVLYLLSHKFITGHKSMIDYYYDQIQTVYGFSDAYIAGLVESETNKVFGYDPYTVSLLTHKLFWVWGILATISVVLTSLPKITTGVFYFFHFLAGGIYTISLLPRYMIASSDQLPTYFASSATSSLTGFFFIGLLGTLLILAMALKKDRFISLPAKGIYHTMGAGVVAFIAMIILNPFHLTNLTHTFEISLSKHAESWRQVNEWKPAFDWMDKTTTRPNPVGNEEAFAVLCILTGIVLIVWLICYFLKPRPQQTKGRRNVQQQDIAEGGFSWPKIDLALIVISLLTIYMAIRSRRFIAIAGVACPILALFVQQIWQMITASVRWTKDNILRPITLPSQAQMIIQSCTVLIIAGLCVFWTTKYKRIFLDPWPSDDHYHNVFMRMTASHLKPFEVCDFINANQISGRVFNYWTEGGAVAFGQNPNPETGEIPLKLFMDGRAQAAYNHDKFKLWQNIFSGGPIAQKAMSQEKRITPERMKEVGAWINGQLAEYDVWVVLMPKSQENSTFMRALKQTGNWKTAYLDNTQHLLVNIETPRGKDLIDKILSDKAVFPDVYTKNITTTTAIIENNDRERFNDLYPLAKAAFEEHPDLTAAIMMTRLTTSSLRPQIAADLQTYLNDFVEHRQDYQEQDGYFHRLAAAEISARFLSQFYPKQRKKFSDLAADFRDESESLALAYLW